MLFVHRLMKLGPAGLIEEKKNKKTHKRLRSSGGVLFQMIKYDAGRPCVSNRSTSLKAHQMPKHCTVIYNTMKTYLTFDNYGVV